MINDFTITVLAFVETIYQLIILDMRKKINNNV